MSQQEQSNAPGPSTVSATLTPSRGSSALSAPTASTTVIGRLIYVSQERKSPKVSTGIDLDEWIEEAQS